MRPSGATRSLKSSPSRTFFSKRQASTRHSRAPAAETPSPALPEKAQAVSVRGSGSPEVGAETRSARATKPVASTPRRSIGVSSTSIPIGVPPSPSTEKPSSTIPTPPPATTSSAPPAGGLGPRTTDGVASGSRASSSKPAPKPPLMCTPEKSARPSTTSSPPATHTLRLPFESAVSMAGKSDAKAVSGVSPSGVAAVDAGSTSTGAATRAESSAPTGVHAGAPGSRTANPKW